MYRPIPEETVQHILNQIDLVEVIGAYVQLRKTGKNFMGLCPFHSEKTPSFSVSPEKQLYHCFGCGKGGNAFTFLMEMEGLSFTEAVYHLANQIGFPIEAENISPGEKRKRQEKEWMLKAHHLVAQLYHHVLMERKEGREALDYLKQRGFDTATIQTFQLGFAPNEWDFVTRFLEKRQFSLPLMEKAGLVGKKEGGNLYFDRFRGRLIFPIWNHRGQVVGFGGRLLGEGHPKYLNSPETIIFRKSKELFNFHRARQAMRTSQTAILLEGFADVLSLYQAGFHQATATLGTALSEEQARILKRNVSKVIICYDGDQAGMQATLKAAELLEKESCLVKVAVLPDGMDPDDYIRSHGAEAFREQVIEEAQSVTAFRLEQLKKGRRLDDHQELSLYLEEALRVISRLNRAIEREHYLRQLSDEFLVPMDVLKKDLYRVYRQRHQKMGKPVRETIHVERPPQENTLAPAHIKAEQMLLAYMLNQRDVAERVEQVIGNRFNDPHHQRLAAHLYAFYARHDEADLTRFVSTLEDNDLIGLVGHLASLTLSPELSPDEFEDYVYQIITYPYLKVIEKKEREKKLAERQGKVEQAAQIAMEIIEMKKRLKSLPKEDVWSIQNLAWKEG